MGPRGAAYYPKKGRRGPEGSSTIFTTARSVTKRTSAEKINVNMFSGENREVTVERRGEEIGVSEAIGWTDKNRKVVRQMSKKREARGRKNR